MKIIECPRDAMQGIQDFIPTAKKVAYINQLLKVGFDTIDFGSFVSPKAVPQMRDTVEVLEGLDLTTSTSKLLAIVANLRGASEASSFSAIHYLGFPLSLSETFQQRNTNRSIDQALETVQEIQNVCLKTGKSLVVYLSMGFGNPYNDPYNPDIVLSFVAKLKAIEVKIISLSDTIGIAEPQAIASLFEKLLPAYPELELGAHLHSTPHQAKEKIAAAYQSGCNRFDGALKGYGGCPMAKDDLTGNMATEVILAFLKEKGISLNYDWEAFSESIGMLDRVFPQ